MSSKTVSTVKNFWNRMTVPQRVEWCKEAEVGGQKGSLSADELDIDMIDSLSQVAIIISDKKETKMGKNNGEAAIEEATVTDAQEPTPEANKAKKNIMAAIEEKPAKKVKKTKAEKQVELGKEIANKKDKVKEGKVKKEKVEKKVEKVEKTEKTVAKGEKPANVAKAWGEATNMARYNMCKNAGVRTKFFRTEWVELAKEDKIKINVGDTSILTVRGKAGKVKAEKAIGDKSVKTAKTAKSTGGDLVGGGMDIKLKNIKDFGGGAILAKGIDGKGKEYVVFMAPKKS